MCLLLPAATFAATASGDGTTTEPVSVLSVSVRAHITDHYATTRVDTLLANPAADPQEFLLTIAKSETAFITGFAITYNGTTTEATLEPAAQAEDEYEQAQAAGNAAGLVSGRDTDLRLLRISVPARAELTVHFTYEELLYRTLGEYRYRLPLVGMAGGHTLGELRVEGVVEGHAPIDWWNVSDGSATSEGPTSFSFALYGESVEPAAPYAVRWTEDEPTGAGTFLTHATDAGVAFVHVFSAEGAGFEAHPLPKDIVFVIDKSGSMQTVKMGQAKAAFTGILADLGPEDRIGVVIFDTNVQVMKDKMVPATPAEVSAAQQWVSTVSSGGSTNIDGALATALQLLSTNDARAPIVVLLTDGVPSTGVTDPAAIRGNLLSRNTMGAAVFTLGFGDDADETLLKQMAIENNGAYRKIYEDKDATEQITGFYATFSTPLLTNITVTYAGEPVWVSQTAFRATYAGSDLVVTGLLPPGTESVEVQVRAEDAGGLVQFSVTYGPPLEDGGAAVERAAAYARLRDLANRALVGEEGARENATALALEYGFVCPFTSLVVVAPEGIDATPAFPTSTSTSGGGGAAVSTQTAGASGSATQYATTTPSGAPSSQTSYSSTPTSSSSTPTSSYNTATAPPPSSSSSSSQANVDGWADASGCSSCTRTSSANTFTQSASPASVQDDFHDASDRVAYDGTAAHPTLKVAGGAPAPLEDAPVSQAARPAWVQAATGLGSGALLGALVLALLVAARGARAPPPVKAWPKGPRGP